MGRRSRVGGMGQAQTQAPAHGRWPQGAGPTQAMADHSLWKARSADTCCSMDGPWVHALGRSQVPAQRRWGPQGLPPRGVTKGSGIRQRWRLHSPGSAKGT